MTDPPITADGLCGCGCGRTRNLTVSRKSGAGAAHRRLLEHELRLDPFASSACARSFHRCPVGGAVSSSESADDWPGDPLTGHSMFSLPRRTA